MSFVQIPPKNYSSTMPGLWVSPIDKIGSTIYQDDELIVVKDLTINSYLESVGKVLSKDYMAISHREHLGASELIFETKDTSYYMMYVDPLYSYEETIEAVKGNRELPMNELASTLSPNGVGVYGNAIIITVNISDTGEETLGIADRGTLAMILSKKLNHVAIQVVNEDLKTAKEVMITNRIENELAKFTQKEVVHNVFGVEMLCLSVPKKDSRLADGTKLYIGLLDRSRKAIRSLELEHFKHMKELSDKVEIFGETHIMKGWKKVPELRNKYAQVKVFYKNIFKAEHAI